MQAPPGPPSKGAAPADLEAEAFWAKSPISRPEPRTANSGTGRSRRVRVSGPGGRAFGPRAQSTGRNPGPLTAARGRNRRVRVSGPGGRAFWAKGPISRPEPRAVEGGTGRSRRVRVSGPWRPSVLRPRGENKPAGTRSWRRQRGAQSEGPRKRTWRPSVWAKSPINRPEHGVGEDSSVRRRKEEPPPCWDLLRTPDRVKFCFADEETAAQRAGGSFSARAGRALRPRPPRARSASGWRRRRGRSAGPCCAGNRSCRRCACWGDAWESAATAIWSGGAWRPSARCPGSSWSATARRPRARGVAVHANALCWFQVDAHGVTLALDVRSGGAGLVREAPLDLCRVRQIAPRAGESAFAAGRRLAETLCPVRRLPARARLRAATTGTMPTARAARRRSSGMPRASQPGPTALPTGPSW